MRSLKNPPASAVGSVNPEIHPLAGVLAALARLISGVRVRWLDCRPDIRQRVYFANHTSHLDFVVLWSTLPTAVRALTRPVAARDYWERTAMRRFLAETVFRAVLIERHPLAQNDGFAAAKTAVNQMAEALGKSNSVIVFPEGTRGPGDSVGPFKSGIYHLCARRPDVELVPVYLENLNRILPKGEVLPVPLLSTATFGPPIRFLPEEPKKAFLGRAREALWRLGPR